MSNAISRRLRRKRGLPALEVSDLIISQDNMFWVEDVSAFRSHADAMMFEPDIPLKGRLDNHIMLGQNATALAHLDDYWQVAHTSYADHTDDESLRLLRNLMTYAGSYVGECLLQEVPDVVWLTSADIKRDHPRVIYAPVANHCAFPFGKVFKFLMNGRKASTRFFVRVMADQMVTQ